MDGPVERARRAIERVERMERRNTRALLRELELLRRQLVAPLAGETEFDARMRRRMLAEAERVILDLQRTVTEVVLDTLRTGARFGAESALQEFRVQVTDADPGFAGISTDVLDFTTEYSPELIQQVTDGTRREVRRILMSGAIGSDGAADVATKLGRVLSQEGRPTGAFGRLATQVERLARTETSTIHQLATKATNDRIAKRTAREARKSWIASSDSRTREAHRHLDGVTIAQDEHFNVGAGPRWSKVSYEEAERRGGTLGQKASVPLDLALSAGQRINCRCSHTLEWGEANVGSLLDLIAR